MMLQSATSLQEIQQRYRWFQQMQREHPVWLDEISGCWHVFRYEDVHQAVTDYSVFSSERNTQVQAAPESETLSAGNGERAADSALVSPNRSLLDMDPPQHRQYRNLVTPAFTPRALERLSGRIATITQELIDQVKDRGEMDLVDSISYPLPTIVICEMLGAPVEDRPLFRKWADTLLSQQLSDAEFSENERNRNKDEFAQTFREMSNYFHEMLVARRKNPRTDMMTDLAMAEIDGERLSMDEVVNFCILLLLAGHVTTTNLLTQAMRCFDEYPGVMEQLRRKPALMPGAIEEVLRYASPVWRVVRTVKSDTTLAGVTIPAKSMVFAWVAAANRDPAQFSEPDRFDIQRSPNRHVSFGHGIHFCIGAPLSRLETSIALPMILEQLPGLRQIPGEPGELFQSNFFFGFKSLPVRFSPA